jgi:hypothetical protein
VVVVDVDASGAVEGLDQLEAVFGSLLQTMGKVAAAASAMAAAVAGAIGAVVAAATSEAMRVGQLGTEIARNADALALTTDEYQELGYAVTRTGDEMDDFADAIATISDKALDAKAGNKTMIEDFGLLGISVDKLRSKRPIDLFEQLADAMKSAKDPTRRLAAASRLLGDDTARKLVPLLRKGSVGIKQLREEAKKAGIVLDKDTIVKSQEYAEVSRRLQSAIEGVRNAIGSAFLPALISITDHLAKVTQRAKDFLGPLAEMISPEVLLGVAALGFAIATVTAAVLGLAAALLFAGPVFTGVAAVLTVIGGALGVVLLPVEVLAFALGVLLFQALVTLGLALGAFVLLAAEVAYVLEDLYVYSQGGTSAIGTFFAAFGEQDSILGATARLLSAIVEQLAAMVDLGLVVADLFANGMVVAFNAATAAAGTLLDKLSPITNLLATGIAGAIDAQAAQISGVSGTTGRVAERLGGDSFAPILAGATSRPGDSYTSSRRTVLNQRNNISVNGAGSPGETANAVAQELLDSTFRMAASATASAEEP